MKRLLAGITGLFFVSCGDSGKQVEKPPSTTEWLVQGEVEPQGQFVLTTDQPEATGAGKISGPGPGLQDYRVFVIDTRSAEKGTLVIELQMDPEGECAASLDLFDAEARMPSDPEEQNDLRMSKHCLASEYGNQGIKLGEEATLAYDFDHGQIFQLGITGDWFSPQGSQCEYEVKVSIE